jgi:hypothetical protein
LWWRSDPQFDRRGQLGRLFFLLFLGFLFTTQAEQYETEYDNDRSKTTHYTTCDCSHFALV